MRLINRTKSNTSITSRAELFGTFIEVASEGFFIFDKNLSSIEMNNTALTMANVSHSKTVGTALEDLLPNGNKSGRMDVFHEVIRTGEPHRFRDYIVDAENGNRLFDIAAFKIGNGLGMIVFEVTERKIEVDPFISMGQGTDVLQSLMHEPFVILDSENRILSANLAFFDQFKLKPQAVYQTLIYDLGASYWNDHGFHELLDHKLPSEGRVTDYKLRGYFTGVAESVISIDAQQFYHETESKTVTFLLFRDVGDAIRSKDKLMEMSEIFSNAPDPMIITDLAGEITKLNNEAVKLYGWSRAELLGKSFKAILPAHGRDQFDNLLKTVIAAERVEDIESEHWSKRGEMLPINLSMALLKNSKKENIGTIAYIKHIASQSQAEKSLKRFRDMILTTNDPVIMMDLKGIITDVNPAAENTYGYSKSNMIGKSGTTLVSVEDLKKYLLSIADCIAGKKVSSYDIRRITKSGQVHNAHISLHLLTNVKNDSTGIAVVAKHFSDREKANRTHEMLLKNILDIRDPVIVEDMNGEIVDLNAAAVKIYGWKKSELIGKKGTTIIPVDKQKAAAELMQKCKSGEHIKDVDSLHWSKSGTFLPVQVSMFQVFDSDETPQNIVTICIPLDATTAAATSGGSSSMEMLFQENVDPIVIEDLSGNVVDMNEAAKKMLGWKKSELRGKPIKNVIPQDQQKQHEKILLLCQNNVPIVKVESKVWSKTGVVSLVSVSLVPLKDAEGHTTAIANIFQDITEFVRIRQQKQKLEKQLGYH
mgnify:CR=1 FL=1